METVSFGGELEFPEGNNRIRLSGQKRLILLDRGPVAHEDAPSVSAAVEFGTCELLLECPPLA